MKKSNGKTHEVKKGKGEANPRRMAALLVEHLEAAGGKFCMEISWRFLHHMGVSKNRCIPKSSILIGFPLINHPFWGTTIFGNTPIGSAKPHISLTFNLRTLGRLPATKSYLSFLGENLGQINTGYEL